MIFDIVEISFINYFKERLVHFKGTVVDENNKLKDIKKLKSRRMVEWEGNEFPVINRNIFRNEFE